MRSLKYVMPVTAATYSAFAYGDFAERFNGAVRRSL